MMSILYISLVIIAKYFVIILPVLISMAYLTLIERKVIGEIQRRPGPNLTGLLGLMQPFADALKLLVKEDIVPKYSSKFIFIFAPILVLTLSLITWSVIPVGESAVIVDLNLGVLFLFAVSSLGVYGIIIAGWSSNSKYAFLGAIRSAAQMVSYEVSIGLILMTVVLYSGSLNLTQIVEHQRYVWYVLPMFPLAMLMFIAILAETNRAPFDLPEAEAELVAGFNVEYSSMGFALFFLGEYINILIMSCFMVILFLGGWLGPFFPGWIWFGLKLSFVLYLFVAVRSAYPRFRYDQLMKLGWKVILPLALGFVWLYAGILIGLDAYPVGDSNVLYVI